MVLPEELCNQLAALAKKESRTVSNMAKVIIQEGVRRYSEANMPSPTPNSTEGFRSALEAQEIKRLKGARRRLRFYRPR